MKKPNERGVSAVEFALLLPVLVVILFGIIEFGLLLYNQQVITNASREGARAGTMYVVTGGTRPTLSDITNVVTNYTNGNLVSFASGTVTPTVTLGTDGACVAFGTPANGVQVNVSYRYTLLMLNMFGFVTDSGKDYRTLQASTTMRCE